MILSTHMHISIGIDYLKQYGEHLVALCLEMTYLHGASSNLISIDYWTHTTPEVSWGIPRQTDTTFESTVSLQAADHCVVITAMLLF